MARNILIVEDAENTRGILSFLLKNKGYSVTLAADGEQAIREIEAKAPDLVVLDAWMPKLSGYDVCARLKGQERTRSIPVILLTAQSQEAGETIQRWKPDHRPDQLVAKPFKVQDLLAQIEGLLSPSSPPPGRP